MSISARATRLERNVVWFRRLGYIVMLYVVTMGSSGLALKAVAQSPVVYSNLEQAAGIAQTRHNPSAQTIGPIALPDDFTRLRLGPGDTLEMEVFGIPELTQTLHVDKDGLTVVPLIGAVPVGGLTLREAEQAIAHALSADEMVNSPQVSLSLTQFAPQGVIISGEVQNPGEFHLLEPRPLLRVIADAGGLTPSSGGQIELRHRGPDGQEQIQHIPFVKDKDSPAADAAIVYPGDTIFVARAGVVYVLGAVTRPGAYLMVNNGALNLPQAVGLALGATLVASAKTVIVVRDIEGKPTPISLRLDRMSRGEIPLFQLRDGDMVYVPTSGIKSTLVAYSSILSAATSAGIIAGIQR